MVSSPIVDWIESVHRRAGSEAREAYTKLERGDLPGAERLFRSALELDPCSKICWRGLGTVLRTMRRPAEAVDTLEQAVAGNSDDPEIWRQLGLAYREIQRPQEALRCLGESMARGGRDTTPLVDIAEIHAEQGQLPEAAGAYLEIYSATRSPEAREMYERILALATRETPREDPVQPEPPDAAPRATGMPPGLRSRYEFPPVSAKPGWMETLVTRLGFWGPIRCPVCGNVSVMHRIEPNVRETSLCKSCGSNNRKRQIGYVIAKTLSSLKESRIRSAADLVHLDDFTIFNTEAEGALHEVLKPCPGYISSEYFGPSFQSGHLVGGVMHQDLTDLSFGTESMDLVISSDVMEHIPHPYTAHAEIFRVLKPGGRHVFTVPFGTDLYLDQEIARLDSFGKPVFFGEPMYHGDPVRGAEGAPVFRIFGMEMVSNLARLGFRTNLYILHSMWHGIFGHNLGCGTVVFDAVKP